MTHRTLRSAIAGRGFMLLPAAAYAVHQGRYRIGYGSDASRALAAQGHGYLDSLAPWVAVLLALAFGAFLVRVARAARSGIAGRLRRSAVGLWFLTTLSLLVIYSVQEWLEGLFAAGHPAGLAGIFGHGGGWAVALSAAVAVVVTAFLRFSAAVVQAASRVAGTRFAVQVAPTVRRRAAVLALRRSPLADARAGRAPPAGRAAASA